MSPKNTNQMDGLFTLEDIAKKNNIFVQCRNCWQWTSMTLDHKIPCGSCNNSNPDPQSTISERSFNPQTAKRRRRKTRNS